MGVLRQRLEKSNFWLKLLHWEYWPIFLANIPVVLFWWWFALRSRRLFFFSAVNPAIETGGVLGERKIDILRRIPDAYIPITIFIEGGSKLEVVTEMLEQAKMQFPVVAKPNIGERGLMVKIIDHSDQLQQYINDFPFDFIIQEYIEWEEEVSVLYHRFPDADEGKVTSICLKKKLEVTGDGQKTIKALMQESSRARLQLARFEADQPALLQQILANGASLQLEPIGNHSRGTQFLSGNHLISPAVHQTFHKIGQGMEGIHYGRFDLKCKHLDSLQTGEGISILEFNGVAGEPAHIYDPAIPIWKKYRDYYQHWKIIYQIYKVQRQKGIPAMTIREAREAYRTYQQYMKSIQAITKNQ